MATIRSYSARLYRRSKGNTRDVALHMLYEKMTLVSSPSSVAGKIDTQETLARLMPEYPAMTDDDDTDTPVSDKDIDPPTTTEDPNIIVLSSQDVEKPTMSAGSQDPSFALMAAAASKTSPMNIVDTVAHSTLAAVLKRHHQYCNALPCSRCMLFRKTR